VSVGAGEGGGGVSVIAGVEGAAADGAACGGASASVAVVVIGIMRMGTDVGASAGADAGSCDGVPLLAMGAWLPESAATLVGCIQRSRYVCVPAAAALGLIAKPRLIWWSPLPVLALLGCPGSARPLPLLLLDHPPSLGGGTKAGGASRAWRFP
jgi:hypothetical protein